LRAAASERFRERAEEVLKEALRNLVPRGGKPMRAVVKKGITVGVGLLLLIGGIPVMGVKRAPARERGGEGTWCWPPFLAGMSGGGEGRRWEAREAVWDLPPVRAVRDPYPVFNGIAVDGRAGRVFMSDGNRKGVVIYGRETGEGADGISPPVQEILGPQTEMGFVAGIAVDPERQEVYVVNNDIEDRLVVFGYEAQGNAKPRRVLYVPHQSWGLAVNRARRELVISVQSDNMVVIYRQEAQRFEAPLRVIVGPETGLADPRGVAVDERNGEIFVANHGNWRDIPPGSFGLHKDDAPPSELRIGGRFFPPSVTVYSVEGKGNVAPRRVLQGERTGLNWPMGIAVDERHQELFVANAGDNSILVFSRTAAGDVSPVRVLRGEKTQLARPVAVAVDVENNELWVTNFLDHTALVFDRTASGDVAPKRVIRTAPAGVPALGFINPMAVAYDSRRDEIIVANCVSYPQIAIFGRLASGAVRPVRTIQGQKARLGRTMHGIAYNPFRDEIIVPNPLAAAILIFRGGAHGDEAPIRIIQGPRTKLMYPHSVALDPEGREIYVGDTRQRAVLVFPVEANGDVPPVRMLQGPRTELRFVVGIGVEGDTVAVASTSYEGRTGIFFFRRTDSGDVAPQGAISGPRTGLTMPWGVQLVGGKLFVTNNSSRYTPPYVGPEVKPEVAQKGELPTPWHPGEEAFIGVWDVGDRGDIPPRALIRGSRTGLLNPAAIAVNPKAFEVYVTDSGTNGFWTFLVPEAFGRGRGNT
jgi:DNA-binding beta-propeller fold protein YncE